MQQGRTIITFLDCVFLTHQMNMLFLSLINYGLTEILWRTLISKMIFFSLQNYLNAMSLYLISGTKLT